MLQQHHTILIVGGAAAGVSVIEPSEKHYDQYRYTAS